MLMNKDFFKPLKEPLQKDHLLLSISIIVGVLVIGITFICHSIPTIILLSLLVFCAAILAYCYIKNNTANDSNKG